MTPTACSSKGLMAGPKHRNGEEEEDRQELQLGTHGQASVPGAPRILLGVEAETPPWAEEGEVLA